MTSTAPAADLPHLAPDGAALSGRVVGLRRHPLKGFTPEALDSVRLTAGAPFPHDRLFAVERGPCGFDPAAPRHIPKSRFAVLANTAAVARVRSRFDPADGRLHAEAPGAPPFEGVLGEPQADDAFVRWLRPFLGEEVGPGELRVIPGAGWRFFDSPDGHVSLLNLASVRDLGERMGAALHPDRFRANLWVEGWPAWSEMALAAGTPVRAGAATLTAVRPIRRCAAIHVDPLTAERDLDVSAALRETFGHLFCGLYMQVAEGGDLALNDPIEATP